jgi:L-2,4-diaminobutyric acid acetyltransferase
MTALLLPDRPDALFVWQIGVARSFQGRGIGRKMLVEAVKRNRPAFVEATIEAGNGASLATFQSVARHFCADWKFSAAAFFDQADLGPRGSLNT